MLYGDALLTTLSEIRYSFTENELKQHCGRVDLPWRFPPLERVQVGG